MPHDLPPAVLCPQELLARLGADGTLHDVHALEPQTAWLKHRSPVAVVEGALYLDDQEVRVQVGLKADFPVCLPVIAVDPTGALANLPHVELDGAVCYRPQDEPLLDRSRPAQIIREALAFAVNTLRTGLKGNRAEEFASEIVAYWRNAVPEERTIISLIEPDDEIRIVTAFLDHGKRITVADKQETFATFRIGRNVDRLTFANALYVPIDPAGLASDFHPRMLATPEGVRRFVMPVLKRDRAFWYRILQRCRSKEVLVVLGVRRSTGRRGLIGLLFREGKGTHPLDPDRLEARRIVSMRIAPADRGFLVPRGGADVDLANRRVLVIGCGAVGGYVAMNLARAGVGRPHLMDREDEEFEVANTFRHVCGRNQVGRSKVEGLKLEIERLLPFVSVTAHPMNVLDWMRKNPTGFRDFDLVIVAIGNPTVELRVNEVIAADPKAPPAIFAWLEPFGLGGHVLLTHIGVTRGCFECLYDRGEDGALACRTAFASPGARYTRDMMGCGSQHMTYGDLDAQKTALSVARHAIDVLQSKVAEGELISWKGSADAFRKAGFKTTRRYDRCEAETVLPCSAIIRKNCPLCQRP